MMELEKKIMNAMREAMKKKDQERLTALRAVKSEILKAKTASSNKELTQEEEAKLLQKQVKQRKESAEIYQKEGREDLAETEQKQAEVIAEFLPEQMTEAEIEKEVDAVITETGASGMKDMGKVMGMANQRMAGKADGGTISKIAKQKLA